MFWRRHTIVMHMSDSASHSVNMCLASVIGILCVQIPLILSMMSQGVPPDLITSPLAMTFQKCIDVTRLYKPLTFTDVPHNSFARRVMVMYTLAAGCNGVVSVDSIFEVERQNRATVSNRHCNFVRFFKYVGNKFLCSTLQCN